MNVEFVRSIKFI